MKKLGVIVAMDKELAQLRSLLDDATTERHNHKDFVIGRIGNHEVVLQQCGIGKVNSAIGAVEMIDNYHPDLIISTGCAGGADTALNPLDVVVASECVYHDVYCGDNASYGQVIGMPPTFKAAADLVEKALTVEMPEGAKIVNGLTVSGDWFVDSRQKMQDIISKFPNATAVDMESCSIAQACFIYKTPFISFRVVSEERGRKMLYGVESTRMKHRLPVWFLHANVEGGDGLATNLILT